MDTTRSLHDRENAARPDRGPGPSTTETMHAQTKGVRDDLQELGGMARDLAHEKLDEVRSAASTYYEEGRRRMAEWEGAAVDYVRRQPLKSLLIVAGAGVLVGMLMRRR
jgi:ElaB/YqjD/DUF883 family membrane-anchored ribosome-binding protein